jgi:hypothetical protein
MLVLRSAEEAVLGRKSIDGRRLKIVSAEGFTPFPNDQYVTKKNRTPRICDGKEWEKM